MPVDVPPETGAAYQTSLDSLSVVRAAVPQMEGQPVNQRLLAVVVKQAQPATVEWTLRDQAGRPVRLPGTSSSSISQATELEAVPPYGTLFIASTPCPEPVRPTTGQVMIADALTYSSLWPADAVTIDAEAGKITFKIPDAAVANAGIKAVEIRVLNGTDVVLVNSFYIWVERSLFAAMPNRAVGCPAVQDIRTAVRDTGPNDNYLLARLEWSVGELAEGVVQAIATWNRSWPNVGGKYSTSNFLDPDALIGGVLGYIYRAAGTNYGRNDLGYAAAGVAVDDKRKADHYLNLAEKFEQGYMNWIKQTKLAISKGGFIGSVGSSYATTAWWARVGIGGV